MRRNPSITAEGSSDGGEKFPVARKSSVRNQAVAAGVEAGPIGAVGLKGEDAAGPGIVSVEQGLKGFQYRGIGGLGQQSEQGGLALEQAAQEAWDGKDPVTVRDGR
jgi:hypothetical protein